MEAVLKYNLPEDQYDFNCAIKGHDWQMVMWDLDQKLRAKSKYEEIHSMDIADIRDLIRQLMEDRNVQFDA